MGRQPSVETISCHERIIDEREWRHLGLSGMKRMPTPRMIGQMIPIPTTVRQEAAPCMCRVAMEMQSVV
jgi:hypothetical protein